MKALCALFIFFVLITQQGVVCSDSSTTERLWVSFLGKWGDYYVVQIDASGNVISSPQQVLPKGFPIYSPPALSLNGRNALNIWYWDPYQPPNRITRLVFEKRTLQNILYVQTGLWAYPDVTDRLDVTNRDDGNFISFHVMTNEGVQLVAYPVNEFGRVTGQRWPLSPILREPENPGAYRYVGGTSRDGGILYWSDWTDNRKRLTNLYVRPLSFEGRPVLQSTLIDQIRSQFQRGYSLFFEADVSDILKQEKRFFVYRRAHPVESVPQILFLQQIDARTGRKIGQRVTIARATALGNVRIDPLGRFILYSFQQTIADDELIVFQALDSNGHVVGPRKILTEMQVGGADLLREVLQ